MLPAGDVGLLERAITYALGTVAAVEPPALSRATPCPGWDLRALLEHVNDSLDVLHEGIDVGCIALEPAPGGGQVDPVAAFRDRAGRLLGAWNAAGSASPTIAVADRSLAAITVVCTGAIEIAVHGWDISAAGGRRRPIPPELASDMLAVSRLVVTEGTRYPLFAAPVSVPPWASPSDQLVAFLGRHPEA
jgi:uncharacterized protein (TIGR03086 family)